jgi:hypothetical protein
VHAASGEATPVPSTVSPLHRGTPNLDAILVAAAGLSRQQLKAFSLNEVSLSSVCEHQYTAVQYALRISI